MVARVAMLCVVEALVVGALAVAVFGDRGDVPAAREPSAAGPTRPPESRDAPGDVSPSTAGELEAPPTVAPPPERQAVAAKWREDDAVGVLLTGRLLLRDGEPVDANLYLQGDASSTAANVAADGTYAVVGLAPGDWKATLGGTGVVQREETFTLTDEAVQHRDFVVDVSFPVKVRIVTADGEDGTTALRKAMPEWGDFTVAGQREEFPPRLAPTDYGMVFVGDARWDSERNPRDGFAGTIHVSSLPAHVALLQRHVVLEQQVVAKGQEEVRFVVDTDALQSLAGSATLRVVDDATGAPLTAARVSMHTSNRGGMGHKVDEQGSIVLEGLSPGLLQCGIHAPDHENFFHTVYVRSGQRLDLGTIRLGAPQPLTGTVVDAEGAPATSARLRWTELKWRTSPAQFSHNRSARIEANGSFQLWGTGAGPIAVTAFGDDGVMAAAVVDNPPAEPFVLKLAPACRCDVTRPPDPTRTFTLTLCDGEGRAVAGHEIGTRVTTTKVLMPRGTYTFTVHDQDQALVQSGSLTFGEQPCALEIR